MANQSGDQQNVDQLLAITREIRSVVLDLQKSFAAPEGVVFVRSCTSCLSDSCNKPPSFTAATSPQ